MGDGAGSGLGLGFGVGVGLGLGFGFGLGPGLGLGPGAGVTGAGWLIVATWPAIVTVPSRCAPPFDAALNVIAPFPFPEAAPVIVIHGTSATAFQEHPVSVVTFIVPGPPAAGTVWWFGAIV